MQGVTALFPHNIATQLDVINQLFSEPNSMIVFDTLKVIAARWDPKIDLGVKVGTPIEELKRTISYRVYETHKRQEAYMSREKSIFGIPYRAISVPIFEEQRFVGGITIVLSTEQVQHLHDIGRSIDQIGEVLSNTIKNLSSTSEEFATGAQSANQGMNEIENSMDKIQAIVKTIETISAKINILGLNAAIEAARAGEKGHGFAVVADEVRKLGESVRSSTGDIQKSVQSSAQAINSLVQFVRETAQISEQQAIEISQLIPEMERLQKTAKEFSDNREN